MHTPAPTLPLGEVQQHQSQTHRVRGGDPLRCDGPGLEEEEEPPLHAQGMEMGRGEAGDE